ncbi:hypothetical protein F2P81_023686 [Scophthalmus maximus]|uniref:Reverse transcriptase domain-containing protein n=1 Tax=Scophthalmus maximus TaxID=52904 RepID=A0A6A4RKP0_SCOMX|nr:hypothetical protein F2P81_023686 [Scophthalmus maximus]
MDHGLSHKQITECQTWQPHILHSDFQHSPALFTPIHSSNTIVKFADDTNIVGLIRENEETPYREEVKHLVEWCTENNLLLNTTKNREIVVDNQEDPPLFTSMDTDSCDCERTGKSSSGPRWRTVSIICAAAVVDCRCCFLRRRFTAGKELVQRVKRGQMSLRLSTPSKKYRYWLRSYCRAKSNHLKALKAHVALCYVCIDFNFIVMFLDVLIFKRVMQQWTGFSVRMLDKHTAETETFAGIHLLFVLARKRKQSMGDEAVMVQTWNEGAQNSRRALHSLDILRFRHSQSYVNAPRHEEKHIHSPDASL